MGIRSTVGAALLFILPPALKPVVLRVICRARVGRHVSIGWFATVKARHISLDDHASIRALTVISCNGEVVLGKYAQVSSFTLVYGSASLVIGDYSYVGPQSLINNDEDVRLGHHTAFGARAVVYTHGSWLPYTEGYWARFGKVTVGDYVWCAACVFLHPGVTIGDRVFVNSRSVVTGDIPTDSVVQGNPAQVVGRLEQLKRKMTPPRVDAAIAEMLGYFAEVELRRVRGLQPVQESADRWAVAISGRTRRLQVVRSGAPAPPEQRMGTDVIALVNRSGVDAHGGPRLDFTTMTADDRGDELCHALVEFLKRYYGVQLAQAEAGS
ncbi:MAG: transferase [Vicinamibacterales bacterium]